MKNKHSRFKNITTSKDRKLKYEGFCSTCNRVTEQRFDSGTPYSSYYRCIKCKTINVEEDFE